MKRSIFYIFTGFLILTTSTCIASNAIVPASTTITIPSTTVLKLCAYDLKVKQENSMESCLNPKNPDDPNRLKYENGEYTSLQSLSNTINPGDCFLLVHISCHIPIATSCIDIPNGGACYGPGAMDIAPAYLPT